MLVKVPDFAPGTPLHYIFIVHSLSVAFSKYSDATAPSVPDCCFLAAILKISDVSYKINVAAPSLTNDVTLDDDG